MAPAQWEDQCSLTERQMRTWPVLPVPGNTKICKVLWCLCKICKGKALQLITSIALLEATFAEPLKAIRSWNLIYMITIYLVLILTAKKAYIQGKRLFSNDVSMEEFWCLENILLDLRSGVEWRTPSKIMYQTHRMYLQEKGEPSIQNLKWRTPSKIEYQQVEGTYMKRRIW